MLVTLATRTFTPEPTAAALRLGALARALAAGGDRVRVLTSRLAPSVASDARQGADGGVDAGEGAGLVEVRRAPVLRDPTGAVRGYVSYMSFDVPLVSRLLTTPRPDVVVCEPPPTTGVAASPTSTTVPTSSRMPRRSRVCPASSCERSRAWSLSR